MSRRAGAAPPRFRRVGIAIAGLLVLGLVGAVAPASSAAPAVVQQAPDPKPPPPPPPDPKPAPAPPPSPPPPPPSPPPAPPPVIAPPPAPAVAVAPTGKKPTRARPKRIQRTPRKARARQKRAETSRTRDVREPTAAGVPAALPALDAPGDRKGPSPVLVVFAPLLAMGLLMLGLSAVPAARIPWRAVAFPLVVHRSSLVVLGFGTIVLGLVCITIAAS